MPDLDEFFSQSPVSADPEPAPEPVAVEAAPTPEPKGEVSAPPARELPPRGEDGKWIKAEPAPAPAPQEHQVPLSALLAERERRQQAEQALEARKTPEPAVDVWENPAAYVDSRVEQARTKLLEEIEPIAESRARKLFLDYTESEARSRHTDYDAARAAFAEEAQRNPILAQELRQAANPAEYIYRMGKHAAQLREVAADPEAWERRKEQEIRARIEAEMAAKAPNKARVPQSLNTESSKGAGIVGASWAGPTPIEDILPFKRD